jgi:2,3-bisphosphoglycerate-dependent phosphoglycerate mutase
VPREYRQNRFVAPPGACSVILVRHGETEAVRPGEGQELWEGQSDPALAATGRAQAERLAGALAHEELAAVYVTRLRRTHETAAPLLARLALEARVEPGLEEANLGEWEGGEFRIRVAERDPRALEMLAREDWAVIPGAESMAAVTARTTAALARIAARHPGETVLVVVHGGVVGALLAHAARSRPFAFVDADNGSISRLVVAGDAWAIRLYNATSHLDGVEPVSTRRPS